MVKLIGLLKRKKGLTPEEFSRYWHDQHAPLVMKLLPQVKKYVQNHAVRLPGGGEPELDGIGELWYDNLEAWKETADFYRSDKGKVIWEDEDKFIDRSKLVFFLADEKQMK